MGNLPNSEWYLNAPIAEEFKEFEETDLRTTILYLNNTKQKPPRFTELNYPNAYALNIKRL